METKHQFYNLMSVCDEDVTVFVFDEEDTDIGWMLSAAQQVDLILIDVDNCDEITRQFVSLLLYNNKSFYITTDEITPYNLISVNRIYDLEQLVQNTIEDNEDQDDED